MYWLLLLWPVVAVLLGVRIGAGMRVAERLDRPATPPQTGETDRAPLRKQA